MRTEAIHVSQAGEGDAFEASFKTFSGAEESRFAPGTILAGRYRVIGLLGRGGMGEVYRADDLKLHQSVALKFLPELMEGDAPARSRLLRELSLARRVTHPNVCRVYDIGEVDGHPFISMEYVDGENLRTLLLRIGRLPEDKASDLAIQFAHGLAAAHRQAILHGDLKPANMMVDGLGQARITDFGLARDLRGDMIAGGTLAYMAPEQAAGLPATVASDLYSIGLVFYEMFTGQPAFVADLAELTKMHQRTVPTPPSQLTQSLDPAVERVILRCLAKDPRDRPASALEVAQALVADRKRPSSVVSMKTLLVCELVDVTSHEVDGDMTLEWLDAHDRIARALAEDHEGSEIEATDDFQLLFDHPWRAVRYALAYHKGLAAAVRREGTSLAGRVGIHLVEVRQEAENTRVEALDRETAVRLGSLASEGQTLLSRSAFDVARQNAVVDERLRWLAHGSYEIEGLAAPLDIFEVGPAGRAPLSAPRESAWARRRMVQTTVPGWRPAPGLELPGRPNWVVEKKLNSGGYGEVWLLSHRKTGEKRVFKFCWEPESLHAFGREITLFRLLKEELGERGDITRILDWNFEEEPYFIEAEYTAGGSLLEWAVRQGGLARIPLEVRLEVVAQVATALSAAHSVGVLHKDVKPGNVLITYDPASASGLRAKLSDFGIGLVTERRRLDEAGITVLGLTESTDKGEPAPQAGTRLYMAPELLEGKPPTLQADIYALGVMFYQMVIGDFSRALAPGWRRDVHDEILEDDIAAVVDGSAERRLSNALRLAKRLRGLESRREQLAEERRARERAEQERNRIERWHRHRRLTAVVLAASMFFGGGMALLAFRVRQEAERARHNAEAAEQVSEFFAGLLAVSDPLSVSATLQSGNATVQELLDVGAPRLEKEFADRPEIRAPLAREIGKSYRGLGEYAKAEPLLEAAVELHREVHGDAHAKTATALNELALLRAATGDYHEAEGLFEEALAIRRALHGEGHTSVAESLDDLGTMLAERGDLEDAAPLIERALFLRRQLLGDDHAVVALSLNNLAALRQRQGEPESAESLFRESLALSRRHLSEDHPSVVAMLGNLAAVLRGQGRHKEAEPFYRESLVRFRRTLGDEHDLVAMSLNNLSLLYFDLGDYERAGPLLRESEQLYRRLLGNGHPTLAIVLSNRAKLEVALGRHAAAEELIQESLAIFRDKSPADHWRIANANSILGSCLVGFRRFREAEELLLASLPVVQARKRSSYTRELLDRIVSLYEAWNEPDKAAEYQALKMAMGER